MKKIVLIILFFILLRNSNLYSEDFKKDQDYTEIKNVEEYNNKITIRPFVSISDITLLIGHQNRDNKQIEYFPNRRADVGIKISFFDFGISYASSFGKYTKDVNKYGKSDYKDFRAFYYHTQYGIELYSLKYTGFFLRSPSTYGYQEGDPETIRSDLQVKSKGINLLYAFSDGFSLNSVYNLTERQNKFDWSLILMASGQNFAIESNESLIPSSYQSYFEYESEFKSGNFITFDICPGIGFIYPIQNFYIFSMVFIGSGYLIDSHDTLDGEKNNNVFFKHIKQNAKLGAGYNDQMFFLGAFASGEGLNIHSKNILDVGNFIFYIEFFAGYRI